VINVDRELRPPVAVIERAAADGTDDSRNSLEEAHKTADIVLKRHETCEGLTREGSAATSETAAGKLWKYFNHDKGGNKPARRRLQRLVRRFGWLLLTCVSECVRRKRIVGERENLVGGGFRSVITRVCKNKLVACKTPATTANLLPERNVASDAPSVIGVENDGSARSPWSLYSPCAHDPVLAVVRLRERCGGEETHD